MATLAANSEECCIVVENAVISATKQVKELLGACTTNVEERCHVKVIQSSNELLSATQVTQTSNELLSAARLKKNDLMDSLGPSSHDPVFRRAHLLIGGIM